MCLDPCESLDLLQAMTTETLFRQDAYLQTCEAVVTAVAPEGIVLDRTVFYPTSGGQAGDCGTLTLEDGSTLVIAEARKSRAPDASPDDVIHIPAPGQEEALMRLAAGDTVTAAIDWQRRYRHMRFHTATHLLCAVVKQLVDGCSITSDSARLDFAMTDPLERDSVQAGLDALVAAAYPVATRWISDQEMLANPQLVKSMSVSPPIGFGRVRLLVVGDADRPVDLQACGGTHVRNTAEIGAVRITKIEKKSARTRRVVLGWA